MAEDTDVFKLVCQSSTQFCRQFSSVEQKQKLDTSVSRVYWLRYNECLCWRGYIVALLIFKEQRSFQEIFELLGAE